MMASTPTRLSFAPTLPCVECRQDTDQGRLYPVRSLEWHLLPMCAEHIDELPGGNDPVSLKSLRCQINEQLAVIQQLRWRKRHLARTYMRMRRQHAPYKVQRALRRRLNQATKLQAEGMEVAL